MMHAPAMGPRHHLMIAGTGRAGTSALVRYLNCLGLETHLSRPDGVRNWHEGAQAGFEDLPFCTDDQYPPYVVKWPWAYQVIDQILSDPRTKLDAVLVPMRDLVEAAASRSILQRQAMHRAAAWMTEIKTPWEHWATAEGGVIYSVNPVDEARLLAVGFHQLLWRLTHADVPVVLISFPKFLIDPDYLFAKIRHVLPIEVSVAQAREAHAATFDPEKARTDRELNGSFGPTLDPDGATDSGTTALDNIALKRELKRLRGEIEVLQHQVQLNLQNQQIQRKRREIMTARNVIRRLYHYVRELPSSSKRA
jgi:hypothetical protein